MKFEPRRSIWLVLVSAAGRAPGFLIPVLIASFFGAGSDTDAYFLAYGTVLLVGGTLAQGIELSIVPFAARELRQSTASAKAFLTKTAVNLSLVAALLWLVVAPIVIASANSAVRSHVLVYAAWLTPFVLLMSAASVHGGALVAEHDIAASTGSVAWRGAGGLLGLLAGGATHHLWIVGLGLGAGELARVVWLRRRVLGKARELTAPETEPTAHFPRAALGIVTAGFLLGAVPVIEKLIALRLGPGAASDLEYASRLIVVPAVVFDGSLAPQLLAGWSERLVVHGRVPSRGDVWRAVLPGLGIAAAGAVLIVLLAPLLVTVVLHHGRFAAQDAVLVSRLLRLLAIGFIGSMGSLLACQAYFATSRSTLFAALTFCRGALRVSVGLALLSSVGLMAFGYGFAVAEWCFFFSLIAAFRPTRTRPLAVQRVEA